MYNIPGNFVQERRCLWAAEVATVASVGRYIATTVKQENFIESIRNDRGRSNGCCIASLSSLFFLFCYQN